MAYNKKIKDKENNNNVENNATKKTNKKGSLEIKEVSNLKEADSKSLFEIISICIIVSLLVFLISYFISEERVTNIKSSITANKEIQNFIEQYNYILENYYGDIDKNELIANAIDGMLSSLDEYSEFISDDSNNFEITLEGTYEGVGIGINNNSNGDIVIVEVYPNTPAEEAGIKSGDIVKKFNDKVLEKTDSSYLVDMIDENKKMKLTLLRGEETIEAELVKKLITLQSVQYEMKDDNIGYINVSIFANNTYSQFKTALNELENSGMESLVLDLRGNSGGHLSAVENMLYLFMDKSHIIYQTEDKSGVDKTYSKGKKDVDYPIVILQNSLSASASEIMAISLRENLGAYIIGNTSYGKGTVQELKSVNGIGDYKFTTKKWLSPNGNWINEIGIAPDLEISLSIEYLENPTLDNDNQYQAAVHYLKKLK